VRLWPQTSPAAVNIALGGLAWFAVLIAATIRLGRLARRPALTRALVRVTGGCRRGAAGNVGFGVRWEGGP